MFARAHPAIDAAMRDGGSTRERSGDANRLRRRITLQLNDMVRTGKIEKIGRGLATLRWKLIKLARNILYLL